MCIYECLNVCMCATCMPGAFRSQKRMLDLLEQWSVLERELQVVVNCMIWVLGTESGSSERAANALTLSFVLIVAAGGLWTKGRS